MLRTIRRGHGLLVPVTPVIKERSNVMRRCRSVIGAATIISPAHSTEWYRGKEKILMMKVSRLSERISRIEQLLAENLMGDHVSVPGDSPQSFEANTTADTTDTTASNSPSNNQPPDSSSVRVHFAGKELGVISLLTGTPFLFPEGRDWIKARTGQNVAIEKLSPTRAPWDKERGQNFNTFLMNMNTCNPYELPDWATVQAYFQAYKSCRVMRRIFPVIDPELFEETLTTAYSQSPSTFRFGQASARVCVIAFITFVSRLPDLARVVNSTTTAIPIDHDQLATRAQFLMSQVLQESASLDAAQAITILTLFELSSGNMRATNYYAAIAARLIFMLGGNLFTCHATATDKRSQQKHSQLRNLFWICYTIDKDLALRTGQPPTITDENCDLTLPPGYLDRAFSDVENEEAPWYGPVFPFDLRLSMIKARAHRELYSVSSLQKSDAELLKSIRELDDALEEWRLSVPPKWRPTMSFSSETSDPNMGMHTVLLRLNYHLCMTIIHQASGRCKAWMQGQSGMMDGVSSSMALSVEASRSSLCYLEAAEHVVVDGVFWTLIFYPMSALLTIFCSILQNPLDPHSREDLGRLNVATVMMERIFSRKLPSSELVHFKLVGDFILELKRLAECAIDKAWAEQRAASY
ncbi:transcriptional regulator family: Fungal Specific TF [Penicillium concentricum]|uniref:Transcriptional regulator family: Fungal Specific TF n=1 Tax=Penicillium concentricum TaxID=293559 RepID=A0A9W9SD68_9EURO|nr:transcriptional regulator family: Fungal Specific TF [Penicillium concentricum]KAJ5375840.1 transcriptional regulator family: Fungal Specific TF [Penicillium concentricum]